MQQETLAKWARGAGLVVVSAIIAVAASLFQDGSLDAHDIHAIVAAALSALAGYLMKSPIPDPWDGEDRRSPTPPAPQPPETSQP